MTNEEYAQIADRLATQREHHDSNESPSMVAAVDGVAFALADYFATVNDGFCRTVFLNTAGVDVAEYA